MWDFSKGSAFAVTDPFVKAVQTMAGALTSIMDPDPRFKLRGCGIGVRYYGVRIEPTALGDAEGRVWDTVHLTIDGEKEINCGNRCGGRDTLAALMAEDLQVILVHSKLPGQDIKTTRDNLVFHNLIPA